MAKQKWTVASDDQFDAKNKVAEGSKSDKSLDKKRGVPEMDVKKKKAPKAGNKPLPMDSRKLLSQALQNMSGGKK